MLADLLIEQLVWLHSQMRALLDSLTDWTEIRLRFRVQALAGIGAVRRARAPALAAAKLEDIAVVVFSNMKTMIGMTREDAPASRGAPDEPGLMDRPYLAAKLAQDERP